MDGSTGIGVNDVEIHGPHRQGQTLRGWSQAAVVPYRGLLSKPPVLVTADPTYENIFWATQTHKEDINPAHLWSGLWVQDSTAVVCQTPSISSESRMASPSSGDANWCKGRESSMRLCPFAIALVTIFPQVVMTFIALYLPFPLIGAV